MVDRIYKVKNKSLLQRKYKSYGFLCLFVHDDSLTTRTEQLPKCCEPLQKLRERCCTCKTVLSPPAILYITDRSSAILLWLFLLFYVLVFKIFVLLAPYVCYHIFS